MANIESFTCSLRSIMKLLTKTCPARQKITEIITVQINKDHFVNLTTT